MIWFFILFALVAGALLPVQAGVNAQLTRWVGHPALAALVSFSVGTLALAAYAVTLRSSWPDASALASFRNAPWWVWTGGLIGALFVTAAAALVHRVGAATFTAVTITGQMLISLLLDHYGLLGFPARSLSLWRVVGALLLMLGVVLIRRF